MGNPSLSHSRHFHRRATFQPPIVILNKEVPLTSTHQSIQHVTFTKMPHFQPLNSVTSTPIRHFNTNQSVQQVSSTHILHVWNR